MALRNFLELYYIAFPSVGEKYTSSIPGQKYTQIQWQAIPGKWSNDLKGTMLQSNCRGRLLVIFMAIVYIAMVACLHLCWLGTMHISSGNMLPWWLAHLLR